MPIGDEVARLPQEWFLNTPVLWLGALVLISTVRSPFRNAPLFIKKLLSLAVAILIALGSLVVLVLEPVIKASKVSPVFTALWILLIGLVPIGLIVSFFKILLSKPSRRRTVATVGGPLQRPAPRPAEAVRNVPAERFADVGGTDEAKEQIRQLVQGHLDPGKYERYGLVRNGILLYGPRGTGKTFLARATAGEFGLHFECVSAPKLLNRWIGATGENIQGVFAQAAGRKPVLFFIDEIDAIGGGRQDAISDPGGAGREFNNITMALMSAIDQYRGVNGFLLMAATNRLDGLDEALIREGRFDINVRVDLPNEATRVEILEAQLNKKPWKRFDLQEFARRTPGASAAKLHALVDQAANYALTDNRKIEAQGPTRVRKRLTHMCVIWIIVSAVTGLFCYLSKERVLLKWDALNGNGKAVVNIANPHSGPQGVNRCGVVPRVFEAWAIDNTDDGNDGYCASSLFSRFLDVVFAHSNGYFLWGYCPREKHGSAECGRRGRAMGITEPISFDTGALVFVGQDKQFRSDEYIHGWRVPAILKEKAQGYAASAILKREWTGKLGMDDEYPRGSLSSS